MSRSISPKEVGSGAVEDVIVTDDSIDLSKLAIKNLLWELIEVIKKFRVE
jgi:hypothetical protein